MESAENKVIPVQVLRRSFRPSEQLESAFTAFTVPGQVKPRFLVKTLSFLALDNEHNYSNALHRARQDAETHQEIQLELGKKVAARRLASGALKLLMSLDSTPSQDSIDHNWLNYLTLMNRTKEFVPNAHLQRDLEHKDFHFFTVISANQAIQDSELRDPAIALLEGLKSEKRTLYHLIPESLSVNPEEIQVLPEYEEPYQQAS